MISYSKGITDSNGSLHYVAGSYCKSEEDGSTTEWYNYNNQGVNDSIINNRVTNSTSSEVLPFVNSQEIILVYLRIEPHLTEEPNTPNEKVEPCVIIQNMNKYIFIIYIMLNDHRIIYIIHILIIAPLLIYIWYYNNIKKQKLGDELGNVMLLLGISTIIYHSYKLVKMTGLMKD